VFNQLDLNDRAHAHEHHTVVHLSPTPQEKRKPTINGILKRMKNGISKDETSLL
jgi:hypothetical protein